LAMIEPVFPLAPKITYMASAATWSLGLFMFVSPLGKGSVCNLGPGVYMW